MKKLIFLVFFSLSLMAFTDKEISDENSLNLNTSKIEDLQSLNQNTQIITKNNLYSLESDLVSVDDDYFVLNVRIYLHNKITGKLLIANQNVETGNVCTDSGNIDRNNIYCDGGTLLNGDRALPSKLKSEHCLPEFLNNPEHEGVYGQYLEKKSELLNSL